MKKKLKKITSIQVDKANIYAKYISLSICIVLGIFLAVVIYQRNTPTAQKISTIKSSLLKMKMPPKADKSIKITTLNQSDYQVKMASTSYVDQAITFKSHDSSLSFTPLDNSVMGAVNKTKMTQKDNVTTYENLYNGVNLVYTSTKDKLLEEYEVRSKKLVTEIIQKIDLQNVDYQKKSDGSIEFYKKGSKTFMYALPKPVMYEKFNTTERNYSLHYEIITQNNISYLVKMIDNDGQKWLSRASYPVMIDGTVVTTSFTTESFPVSLGKWKVRIDTVGTGNLNISALPNSHAHIESLTCSNQAVETTSDASGISVANFNCSTSAFVTYSLDQPNTYSMNITFGQDSQTLTTVYSQTATPVFETAYVDPTLVSPGDIMNVYAHITDESGIASVSADMGGVETISLSKVSGTVNDGQWKATWKVHDTKTKEYITTIKATNVNNVSSTSHEITWFDPYSCLGGGDHAGADWNPATDCPGGIAGNHTNIGTMTVSTGQTAIVQAFDGTNYGTFQASATTVSIVGTLTADAKGYSGGTSSLPNGAGPGGGTGSCGSNSSAGSGGHGGLGSNGSYDVIGSGGAKYDSVTNPTQMGSGGGAGQYGSCSAGGAGGGSISITSSGTLTISGTISANGGDRANFRAAGGSGGSINISSGTVTGAGILRANGGVGQDAASGAGGRIAIKYSTSNTFAGTTTTNAGSIQSSGLAGAVGTIVTIDTTNNDLYISSSQTWDANPALEGSTFTYRDVYVQNNSTWVWKGYNTTNSNGVGITLNVRNITVSSGSSISANGTGYAGGTSSGNGAGPGGGIGISNNYAGGGAYGGKGNAGVAAGGSPSGSYNAPVSLGSGGGADNGVTGGAGGGAIKISASGTVTVSGTISANGGAATGTGAGGGSGGSVYITANVLTGTSPIISANGGAGGGSGGGSGGRVAIYYGSSTLTTPTITATVGTSGTGGENGTNILVDTTNNDLYISSSQTWDANPALEGSTFTYRDVYVQNNSTWVWKGYNTTNSNGVGITLNVRNITVSSGSSISADGKGYAGGLLGSVGSGPGGGTGGTGVTVGGGGYGGKGGSGSTSGGSANGSYNAPVGLGSGGGSNGYDGGSPGGAGGGAIKISASGTVTVSGTISANGGAGSGTGGGGAGGSVYITTTTLTGSSPTIRANGGTSGGGSGGGSGGRVAVYYGVSTLTSPTTSASVGSGGTGGENGTNILVDTTNNDLYINSSQTWSANPALEGSTFTYRDVYVQNSSTWLWKGYYTTNNDSRGLIFNVRNFNLALGSTISADATGYAPGTGLGVGTSYGGGGHGGVGATLNGAGGTTYDSAFSPVMLGSGGGTGGATGGTGGGAVKVNASGTVTVSGIISANGNFNGSGGSGGSIWLTANTLTGSGTVRADGANSSNAGIWGAGGGGRVAVYYSVANSFNGTLTANSGGSAGSPENGTLLITDTTNNDLYIKSTQTWRADPALEGTRHNYHNVFVQNNAIWTLVGYYTTNSNGYGFYFDTTNFNISTGSSINTDGRGYAGGNSSAGSGPGGGASGGGGGGYGGVGATLGGAGGPTYGSASQPTDLGSGGGAVGGAGGGAVRITSTDTLTINGSISSNGANGGNGGGSGGSVYLLANTLTGNGPISANGGNSGNPGIWGAGGGGRIAIYYIAANTYSGTRTVTQGGSAGSPQPGTSTLSLTHAPTITSLGQFQTNCSTSIAVDGNLEGTPGSFTGCFKGTLADGDNPDSLSFEFESQPIGTSFTNIASYQSTPGAYTGTPLTQSISATGFTIATAYHWQARAVDQYGAKSAWASFGANTESQNDFTANLPSPTNINVTYTSDTQLDVSWSNSATTNDSVVIERSTDDGSYVALQTLAANALAYSDTSTSANHKYIYRVKNMLGALSSGYGTGSAVYSTPAAPSGASISQTKMGTIVVSWTDNSAYESNFEVQRKIGSGAFTTISSSVTANATTYIDSTVGQQNDYTYQVRAIRTTPDPLNSAFSTSSALPISLGAGKGVYLTDTGRLFIENDVNKEVDVWTKVQDDTTNQTGTDLSYTSSLPTGGPNLPTGSTINNLTVSQRTSLADGKSDVVYVSTDKGMVMIHENALTPADGAVKRYTKDYISELMIGDVRGTWPLDDSTGSGVFDASNNNQTLTNNGGVTFGSGVRGKSAIFNGSNQYLSIADNVRLSVTGSVTFGAWFKSNSTSTDQVIMSKNGSYTLQVTSAGKVKATINGATTATITSATTIDTGWHHAVVTYSSSSQTFNLYVDGKTDNGSTSGTIPASLTDSSGDFEIGADNGSTFFNGSIDEPFVTAENLTGNHVQFIYLTGYRAVQNHTALAIDGIGADSYQKLLGNGASGATVDNVQVVAIDDNNQFMYIGTNDTSANTGGISVIGTYSDSVVDLYDSTNNTNKKDDNGNQFSGSDITAISVAGVPNPAYRGENDISSYGGTIAVFGSNDTATRLWLENQSYSLNQVLGASTGGGTGTDGLRVPPSLTNAVGTNGEFLYVPSFEVSERGTVVQNYQGVDTDITAMSFNDGVLTSGTLMALQSTTLTTGKLLDLNANTLTSGTGLNLSSSSNAFSGSLANISLTGTTGVTGNVMNLSSTGGGAGNKVLNISATGTGATNTGLYISATGATNNYAAIFANGNVGIGTSTPTQGLEVYNKNILLNRGNLQFNHLSAPGALTAATGTTGSLTGTYRYKVTFVTPLGETEGGTASSQVVPSTKRVELTNIPVDSENIATARKIYRTVDSGTTYFLLTTISDNTTTTYSDNTVDGSLGAALSDFNTTGAGILTDGVKRLQIDQNGNIGIGTTTPAAKLDVNGTVNINGQLTGVTTASASANLSFTGTTTKIQQLNGGGLTWQTSVGGDAGLTTRMALSNAGALTIGTQAANANAKLDVNGNVNLSNATSNTIFYGTAGVAAPGANSAGEKLQLYGTAGTVSSTDYAIGMENNNMWFNSAGGYKWYTNSAIDGILNATGLSVGTVSQANKLDVSGGAAIGSYAGVNAAPTNGLIVSGNVGVGTSTPSTHFQVSDSGAVANGKALVILDQYENQDLLTASASGVTKFSVTSTGVIKGSSFYDLDNASYFIDPSASGTSANLAGGIKAGAGVNIGSTYSSLSSITNGLLVEGNVGIGTSAPTQKLDVAGNLNLYDATTGRANIFTQSGFDKTWTTSADFNAAGASNSAGMTQPATNNELKQNVLPFKTWAYKKPITVDNTGNASTLTNYQTSVTIDTATLIGAGKMNVDCSDMRFTDTDGTTKLNYWIESGCNTSTTKVWVKVPSIAGSSTRTIYMQYGSPTATSESSATKTFVREISNVAASYNMDEASGTTVADSSGNSLNATATGATVTTGQFGNGRDFNGSSQYIGLPTGNANFTNGITLSIWAKPTTLASYARFFDLGNGGPSNNIMFYRLAGGNTVCYETYNGGGSNGSVCAAVITQNVWQQFTVTQTSTGFVTIYKNGVSVATGTIALPTNISRTNNYIGRSNWPADAYYVGQTDEAKIYSAPLTSSEVSDLYSNYGYTTASNTGKEEVRAYTATPPTTSVGVESSIPANSWGYYKAITINNSSNSNALTNYQTSVTLDTATLIGAGKMNADCSDIRFSNGNTILNYWIESGCNTSTTKIWIKVDSIAASSSAAISIYYGNQYAFSQSSSADTFIREISNVTAAYNMDEASGTTVADSSGNGNNGTASGTTVVSGKFGNARNFNGTSDTVATNYVIPTTNFTVEFWANVTSGNTGRPFGQENVSSGSDGLALYNFNSPVWIIRRSGASLDTSTNQTVTNGVWNHYAITISSIDGARIYMNGVLTNSNASATSITLPAGITMHFGSGGNGLYFKGLVDEPKVFNKALTASEISDEYNNYGYTTSSNPGKELVRQFSSPEPSTSVGTESTYTPLSGADSWTSDTIDALSGNTYQPNKFTVTYALDGSDNVKPKFQILGSNTGSFTGEETVYPAAGQYYVNGGTYPITSGTEKDISGEVGDKFRYWKVKAYLDTGANVNDTPYVYDIRLRSYNAALTIGTNNNVGLGTDTATYRLQVQDVNTTGLISMFKNTSTNADADVLGLQVGSASPGTSNYYVNFMDGTGATIGKITGNGASGITYSTSGSDFAEYFKKSNPDETFETGDLVCFASDGGVTKCTTGKTDILGVVSAHPAFAGGSNHDKDPNYVAVGLMGQLPVKVSSENGDIKKGDTLTYSTTDGLAQKATSTGQIIGKALSDLTCDATNADQTASDSAQLASDSSHLSASICKGEVFAYVHASYYDNASGFEITGSTSASLNPQVLGAMTQSYQNIIVSDNATFNNVGITGTISAGTLSMDGLNGSIDSLGTPLKLQSLGTGGIEFEGGLATIDTKGNIRANEITVKKVNVDDSDTTSASVGNGVLKAGSTSIIIKTTSVTGRSRIFVTPTSDVSSPLIVIQKTNGIGFTVKVATTQTKDVAFDWFIVN